MINNRLHLAPELEIPRRLQFLLRPHPQPHPLDEHLLHRAHHHIHLPNLNLLNPLSNANRLPSKNANNPIFFQTRTSLRRKLSIPTPNP